MTENQVPGPSKKRLYLMNRICQLVSFAVLSALSPPAASAPPPDWSKIPVKTIKLFYPGQSSYQWLHSVEHRRGNRQVAKGARWVSCHWASTGYRHPPP